MFGRIKQLFKLLLMFGFPSIVTFCTWVLLDPVTFWQILTTLIVGVIVYVAVFVMICMVLNEWSD